jgi:hypothetical protein
MKKWNIWRILKTLHGEWEHLPGKVNLCLFCFHRKLLKAFSWNLKYILTELKENPLVHFSYGLYVKFCSNANLEHDARMFHWKGYNKCAKIDTDFANLFLCNLDEL